MAKINFSIIFISLSIISCKYERNSYDLSKLYIEEWNQEIIGKIEYMCNVDTLQNVNLLPPIILDSGDTIYTLQEDVENKLLRRKRLLLKAAKYDNQIMTSKKLKVFEVHYSEKSFLYLLNPKSKKYSKIEIDVSNDQIMVSSNRDAQDKENSYNELFHSLEGYLFEMNDSCVIENGPINSLIIVSDLIKNDDGLIANVRSIQLDAIEY